MEKKIVCQNRKASYDYYIEDVYEAGLVLLGPEVKSLREGRASLVDCYARIRKSGIFLHNMHISPYPYAHHVDLDPKRTRKLLLNKKEINPKRTRKLLLNKKEIKRLIGKTELKGYSLIPLKVYFLGSWAKVELALAKGKKKVDKRRTLKEKELKREMEQSRKKGNY
jgi:SsrA-binding protein